MSRNSGARNSGGSSSSGLAAFVSGAMVALIASRLLPPVMAHLAGTARGASGRDPLASLEQDHRTLLSLLHSMERSPNDAVFHRTQLFLRLKRRLAAHAMAEEDVVYPMLHDRTPAADDAKHLYAEHADMKRLLFALETTPKSDPSWLVRVRELRALIEGHIRQEEEVDFPKLRQALSDQETLILSGGVSREKALIL
ncbi:MAG TPA: hemerythrin domain-containing protein [Azospirillum sp.]|nr:hemerythrin domain-containing protein [Azospirillum sp.]